MFESLTRRPRGGFLSDALSVASTVIPLALKNTFKLSLYMRAAYTTYEDMWNYLRSIGYPAQDIRPELNAFIKSANDPTNLNGPKERAIIDRLLELNQRWIHLNKTPKSADANKILYTTAVNVVRDPSTADAEIAQADVTLSKLAKVADVDPSWWKYYAPTILSGEEGQLIGEYNENARKHYIKKHTPYVEQTRRAEELPTMQLYSYKRDVSRLPGYRLETQVPKYAEYTGQVIPRKKKKPRKFQRLYIDV